MALPFFIVTLTHPAWDAAMACARALPEEALPELRLDLFPELDASQLVRDLGRRCLVSCRRASEHGRFEGDEDSRLTRLRQAAEAGPSWLDLEWELEPPPWLNSLRPGLKVLRSVHVQKGVFDLNERLHSLPEGDAFKWVGQAARLADNARLKASLKGAKQAGLHLSAFLMGPKGVASRCLQRAWGGAFTYAAPDDGVAAAPGQLKLSTMKKWGCHLADGATGLCAVMGDPVLHSRGPAFHNQRFQQEGKNMIYLPLECGDAHEAAEALDPLEILGLSITAPLKESLPLELGLKGPLNTLWRRNMSAPWQGANTDAEALWVALEQLSPGPVLLLGDGGVAETTRLLLEQEARPFMQISRSAPLPLEAIQAFSPVGVIQATSLGMKAEDPMPFPEHLEAAKPSLEWAVEWIYKERTAFSNWAKGVDLELVEGGTLFEVQADLQNQQFIEGCGRSIR
ncbi:MAG: type I 3-dehydroquinate dehydratase [Acidobacteriota bacterium]|nr:type I 3-dehydroquinate dehydratase [Acidobacteriota bacterium]